MPSLYSVSDHCDGRRFFNPGRHDDRAWRDVLKWKTTSRPPPWPASLPVDVAPPPPLGDSALAATWIGHATFLLQTRAGAVLTDPVYSNRVGLFGRIGPRRARPPAIPFAELPPIRAVMLSHDHYDHCDLATLRRLAETHTPVVYSPLGYAPLLRSAGFPSNRIVELDWWQSHAMSPDLHVTLTPARHWSNRARGARNSRLWGGFFLRTHGASAYFAGDTAYDETWFHDIRARLGAPDLAMIPIGAYEPRWFMKEQHCDPAEAVRIHQHLGARQSIGMHWGTFPLTDELYDAPPRELASALVAAGIPASGFVATAPGVTLRV